MTDTSPIKRKAFVLVRVRSNMGVSRSRRSVLQLLGGAATVFTAGCFDWLTRSATDSHKRSIIGSKPEHSTASFTTYVERMRERYGDHGVWGIENKKSGGQTGTEFLGAWSGRWVLLKSQTDTTRENGRQLRIPVDYAVVLYRVRGRTDEQDRPVHRLWLWSSATPNQSKRGYGSTTLGELSIGIALDGGGVLGSYAPRTRIRPKDAPVQIGLSTDSNPKPSEPTALRPVPAGRIRPAPTTTSGSNGRFAVQWTGAYGPTISVAGVCEIRRGPEREYELTLTSNASGTQGTL